MQRNRSKTSRAIPTHSGPPLTIGLPEQQADPPRASEATKEEIGAVLIYSRLLQGEIWLVRDTEALADIAAEIQGRPVIFFDEVEGLRGKNPDELREIVTARCGRAHNSKA